MQYVEYLQLKFTVIVLLLRIQEYLRKCHFLATQGQLRVRIFSGNTVRIALEICTKLYRRSTEGAGAFGGREARK